MAVSFALPMSVCVGGKWVPFHELTEAQLVSFMQEKCLNELMEGRPFGNIIAECVAMSRFQGGMR